MAAAIAQVVLYLDLYLHSVIWRGVTEETHSRTAKKVRKFERALLLCFLLLTVAVATLMIVFEFWPRLEGRYENHEFYKLRSIFYMVIWFFLAVSLVLLLHETRKYFYFFYAQNKWTLIFILVYFTAIQINRMLQLVYLSPPNGYQHIAERLEADSLKSALIKLSRYISDYILPALIFCISSHPVDFRSLLVHNSDAYSMRSIFVK